MSFFDTIQKEDLLTHVFNSLKNNTRKGKRFNTLSNGRLQKGKDTIARYETKHLSL